MTTTYTLTVVCDARVSPECVGERVETLSGLPDVDAAQTRRWREGWVRGYVGRDFIENRTHDVCPVCAAVLRPAKEDAGP